jgi:uncharacterized glyoxalase superfamily protein PhnB
VFVSGRPDPNNPWSKVGISSIALVAEDAGVVQQHYERALAAGADMVRKLHIARTPAFPDGSHQFDARDPEGNLWTIGNISASVHSPETVRVTLHQGQRAG